MIVTLDTSVLFAALQSKDGASHAILQLILDEKIRLALSPQVYFEYQDVLSRGETLEYLGMTCEEVTVILDLLALLAQKFRIYYLLRPNLRDERDNLFAECAFASSSDHLITSNVRHFRDGELKGFRFSVVTPCEFIRLWRRML